MENSNKGMGILAMAATAFLWSIAGLFIKAIDWNPIAIAGMRSLVASIVIFAYLRRPVFHFSFAQTAAAITHAVTMLLFVAANKTTTAANAILLQYMAPVLTAFIGSALLKERPHAEHFIALPLVVAGMVVMFFDELGGGKLFGNLLAILLSHWLTAIVCILISLFLPFPQVNPKSLSAIAVLGIVQLGLPSLLFCYAIKRVSAVSANLIAVIEPVFNPVWVFIAIGEAPGVQALIGGLIIVLSVTIASVISAQRME